MRLLVKVDAFVLFICMMLDDTVCGLDASSLHRTISMDRYMVEKFELLSCHRDTSSIAR